MPNWCSNTLTVKGDPEAIVKFLGSIRVDQEGYYEILESLYPCPEELKISASSADLTYEVFFGEASQLLEYPWVKAKGITTVEQLKQYYLDNDPESYAQALIRKRNIEQYGHMNWYDWCVVSWGTKWGDCYTRLEKKDDSSLAFSFDSAWSPPVEALNRIAGDHPQLDFHLAYEEPGMCFRGYARWKEGAQVEDHCEEYVPCDQDGLDI